MEHYVEMWRFDTTRFTIIWDVTPSTYVDLSWDEDGTVRANLESGRWVAFDSRVRVLLDGHEIAADYLGESIYENPSDFRDHFGMNARGHGSYFSDMVRTAVSKAREYVRNMPDKPRLRSTV